jgi:hypothetical protein
VVATSQPDPGALPITPADGYQYRDDHPWTGTQQTDLVDWLRSLRSDQPDAAEGAPLTSARGLREGKLQRTEL